MADTKNKKNPEMQRRGGMWRTYRSEVIAALAAIAVVIGIAFWVNNFFYGFDRTESVSTDPAVHDSGMSAKEEQTQKEFRQSADWRLILVNRDHPLEAEYSVELTELFNGQSVDSRIYPDLQAMFDEMRADGLSPIVAEGYRSREEQTDKLDNKIRDYMEYGKKPASWPSCGWKSPGPASMRPECASTSPAKRAITSLQTRCGNGWMKTAPASVS